MTSPHDDDDQLTPEEEELVEAFQEELAGGISFDAEAEQNWLTTPEGLMVPITTDQADSYVQAVYEVALEKVYAARPKQHGQLRIVADVFLGSVLLVSFTSVVVALAAAAIRALLS